MTFEEKSEIVISQLRADRDRLQNAIEKIRAEIKAKYDGIPWRDSEYNDGWIEALEWVYDDVISKYMKVEYKEEYEPD